MYMSLSQTIVITAQVERKSLCFRQKQAVKHYNGSFLFCEDTTSKQPPSQQKKFCSTKRLP